MTDIYTISEGDEELVKGLEKERRRSDYFSAKNNLEDVKAYFTLSHEELKKFRYDKYYGQGGEDLSEHQLRSLIFDEELEKELPGLFIMHSGGYVPFIAHGFLGDYAFYVHSRGGYVTMNVFRPLDYTLSVAETIEQGYRGHSYGLKKSCGKYDDYYSEQEVMEFWEGRDVDIWVDLVNNLKKGPFMYKFSSVEIDYSKYYDPPESEEYWKRQWYKGIEGTYREALQWADNPHQAYERLCSEEYNYSFYRVDKEFAHPEPLNKDERIFPDVLPDFSRIARKKRS